MRFQQRAAVFSLTLACLGLAGCSQQTLNSAQKDTEHNVAVVNKTADQIAKQAKPQLDKLNREVKPQLDKAGLGAKVQAALAVNENLQGSAIRVDADTGGVRLRGSVKTPAQKTLAERVARDTLGPDKTVTNELQVKS